MINNSLNQWLKEDRWPPIDPSGYVFLARAVKEVGKAIFGAEWTGHEPIMAAMRKSALLLPLKQGDADNVQKKYALSLLHQYRPELNAQPINMRPRSVNGAPLILFSQEEWAAARTLAECGAAASAMAEHRFHRVRLEIARRCEETQLHSAILIATTGQMLSLRPSHWRMPDNSALARRFEYLRLKPGDPFSNGLHHSASWIFLERESLNRMLADLPHGPKPQLADEPLAADAINTSAEPILSTGGVGRPTSLHLIKKEMKRRFAAGEPLPASYEAACRDFSQWLSEAHPDAPPAKPGTIRNDGALRAEYQEMKAKLSQKADGHRHEKEK